MNDVDFFSFFTTPRNPRNPAAEFGKFCRGIPGALMILYSKVVLKVVLNRIINLPDSGYLPDTRYPAGYPVDPDIRYSPKNKMK